MPGVAELVPLSRQGESGLIERSVVGLRKFGPLGPEFEVLS